MATGERGRENLLRALTGFAQALASGTFRGLAPCGFLGKPAPCGFLAQKKAPGREPGELRRR
jgi:hypothetical protein